MNVETTTLKKRGVFDLEERTTQFGILVITVCRCIPLSLIVRPILDQLIRSGTSIGANYREANSASSKRDFRNKISICKKEAEETKHWLQILASTIDDDQIKKELRALWQEAQELTLIFGKILATSRVSS